MKVRADFPDFRKNQIQIQELFHHLPVWVGNAALNFYKDSWRRQGFIDRSFERWPARKMSQEGKAVLVKAGRLRRSLRMRSGKNWVEIYTDAPYAKAHNEGETIVQIVTAAQHRFFWAMHAKYKKLGLEKEAAAWRAMALSKQITIKMPKRQFMGKSAFFDRRVQMHVERGLEKAMR